MAKQIRAGYPEPSSCRTPAPASIVCKGCNREFFARSLPIHQKTCFQKNAFVDIACAKCSCLIRSGRFHAHEQTCTGEKPRALPSERQQQSPSQQQDVDKLVEEEELNEPGADGRVRCRKCGRGFNQDRIAKHQSVCSDKPRGAVSKNKYDAASEAKRGTPSPTILRRRRSQTDAIESRASSISDRSVPAPLRSTSKVVNVSFERQQQHQQKPSAQASQVCASRSYDFGSHFSLPDGNNPGENARERDKKRFDIVLRDMPQRQQGLRATQTTSTRFGASHSSGLSAKSLGLLASNATSAANPLATNRFMTAASIR